MTILQDVRYALRKLRQAPGFTTTALLTLALGIGANAAIFTLVNSVLLQNLPVGDPKTLVRLGNQDDCCVNSGTQDDGNYSLFPTETYELLKKNVPEFASLAAMQAGFGFRPVTVRRDGTQSEARSVIGEFVSGNYFQTFGLRPRAGRLLADADDIKGAPVAAVMSYQAWQRDYAGDASVIGSTFWVNTRPVTVVGIAPEGFFGDRLMSTPPDFYLPIESMPSLANASYVHDPRANWLYIIGRVKPGVALDPLQQKVSALVRQSFSTIKDYVEEPGKSLLPKVHVVLTPGGAGIQHMQEEYASKLHLLMWVAGIVLLIACANIANLLLVRGMARSTELSVRTALGAMRGRIIRQLLTESVVLAVLGGLAGLAVGYAGAHMLLSLAFPGEQNVPIHASPSLASHWLCLRSVAAYRHSLRSGSGMDRYQRATRGRAAWRSPNDRDGSIAAAALPGRPPSGALPGAAGGRWIVLAKPEQVAEHRPETGSRRTAISCTSTRRRPGIRRRNWKGLYRTIEQQFHALPGIKHVGISTYTPMEDNNWSSGVQVLGQPSLEKGASWVRGNAEYFDSVGTHVLMGRGIQAQDTPRAVRSQS